MSEHDSWPGHWDAVERAQRRAWRAASPDERLRWLEEALTFAHEAGALTHDRERRAAEARRWLEQDHARKVSRGGA